MKTQFNIEADTDTMEVTLTVTQDGHEMYSRKFETVTDAAKWLLRGIHNVLSKRSPVPLMNERPGSVDYTPDNAA